jgi:hypothetical protein
MATKTAIKMVLPERFTKYHFPTQPLAGILTCQRRKNMPEREKIHKPFLKINRVFRPHPQVMQGPCQTPAMVINPWKQAGCSNENTAHPTARVRKLQNFVIELRNFASCCELAFPPVMSENCRNQRKK